MKNRIVTRLTLMLLALGLASPALAVDGVLEINETCAQAGCFNGDSPGWPVTIIRAGSYRLTSNLNVPDENTDGIIARYVSTISDNRAYLNGHYGIYVDGRSVVSGNSVSYNGGDGISAGNGATVKGNSATDNGGPETGPDLRAEPSCHIV